MGVETSFRNGDETMDQMNQLWHEVDEYAAQKIMKPDDVLEKTLSANREAGLPAIDVSPLQGKMLNLLARMQGARRILEIGTLGGYSTIWLARALPEGGKLITLEYEPLHAEVADSNLKLSGLRHLVDIRVGLALDSLGKLADEETEPFDFIFIDADKPNNPNYIRYALHLSRPGTVIIGDNVIRDGQVVNSDNQDPRVIGTRRMFDLLSEEPLIDCTAIQTVGSKGYDGFIMGIVGEKPSKK